MQNNNAVSQSLKLMESSSAAYLTTIDESGFPQTRAMLNLRNPKQYPALLNLFKKHSKDFLAYFTTNTSSAKIKQIKSNPAVSVYYCRPDKWHGFMLSGNIEIVDDQKEKSMLWQNGWEMYYSKGATDPDYAILKLKPLYGKLYHQFRTEILNFKDK